MWNYFSFTVLESVFFCGKAFLDFVFLTQSAQRGNMKNYLRLGPIFRYNWDGFEFLNDLER